MDDVLATQLASAMTGIAAGDYRTDGTTAAATFTVNEKFGLFTVHGRSRSSWRTCHRRRRPAARYGHAGHRRHQDSERTPRQRPAGGRFFDTATLRPRLPRSVPAAPATASWSTGSSVRGEDCPLSLVGHPHAPAGRRCRGARDRDVRPDDVAPAARSAVAHQRFRRRRRGRGAAPHP